jgi:hypothetical protein
MALCVVAWRGAVAERHRGLPGSSGAHGHGLSPLLVSLCTLQMPEQHASAVRYDCTVRRRAPHRRLPAFVANFRDSWVAQGRTQVYLERSHVPLTLLLPVRAAAWGTGSAAPCRWSLDSAPIENYSACKAMRCNQPLIPAHLLMVLVRFASLANLANSDSIDGAPRQQ